MKLANKILELLSPSNPEHIRDAFVMRMNVFGFEGISMPIIEQDLEGDTFIRFEDEDGDTLDVMFVVDEEEGPVAIILEDESDPDDGDIESEIKIFDLNSLDPVVINMGMGQSIDLTQLEWLNQSTLESLFKIGDIDDSEGKMSERVQTVVRNGKKVKLALVRKKRKKRLTSKQKAGIRKAVQKRKSKKGQIARKRAKSLKLRKRTGLKKNTNKRLKVKGT